MELSCRFYSVLPGFRLVFGGPASNFSTFEVGTGSSVYLNLELRPHGADASILNIDKKRGMDFGRVIFHSRDVDSLYRFMMENKTISQIATFENEPTDAPWGERYFHVRDPDGYQLSFAQPISAKD